MFSNSFLSFKFLSTFLKCKWLKYGTLSLTDLGLYVQHSKLRMLFGSSIQNTGLCIHFFDTEFSGSRVSFIGHLFPDFLGRYDWRFGTRKECGTTEEGR